MCLLLCVGCLLSIDVVNVVVIAGCLCLLVGLLTCYCLLGFVWLVGWWFWFGFELLRFGLGYLLVVCFVVGWYEGTSFCFLLPGIYVVELVCLFVGLFVGLFVIMLWLFCGWFACCWVGSLFIVRLFLFWFFVWMYILLV